MNGSVGRYQCKESRRDTEFVDNVVICRLEEVVWFYGETRIASRWAEPVNRIRIIIILVPSESTNNTRSFQDAGPFTSSSTPHDVC
jgi:hypothetical protein